ncbi:o-succinylbenzoate synthase [Tunicatimonas pelagia]|uniref:o-succinylbenzoate synthase n=1 Tax=Tunicatimonas pelagia TaxID=931531 RepID=UPI002665E18F|nr:o-succinylbenzoate synthase [Tunicatimonas pelagia]WKN43471.1 o-succinylbenzoate synthase [Tunicatimonas pelagia]
MPLSTSFTKHTLQFTFRAGTSRGTLTEHNTYFLLLASGDTVGIGECAPLKGLSPDYRPDLEKKIQDVLSKIEGSPLPEDEEAISSFIDKHIPPNFPALRFGLETALRDLLYGGQHKIFPSVFQNNSFYPIPINGLVWMGDREFMKQQIDEKLAQGFNCIKLKIGAIDFATELSLLAYIREHYSAEEITIRVDANGAFSPEEAPAKLQQLAEYDLHSIEQPIASGQIEEMRQLCKVTPLPIALDEELIGVYDLTSKTELLDQIQPQYIILKPTLLGGLAATAQWIQLAEARSIDWWMTSALESNIGLNAIAQFAAYRQVTMPQGLGTGKLYHNNISSPLHIQQGNLHYLPDQPWDLSPIIL